MESDKSTVLVPSRELVTPVKQQIIGCPMARKADQGFFEFSTSSYAISIPAVLRGKYFLLLHLIVIAIRPSKICALSNLDKFFRRQYRTLPRCKKTSP